MQPVSQVVTELRVEHDSLSSLVRGLDEATLDRRSYATEWSIAQVLSHLGSGAEINVSNLRAAIHGIDPIPKDDYPALWGRWDELAPADQVGGFHHWHGELVAILEDVDAEKLTDLEVPTAMGLLRGPAVVGMRFREAALHAWDVAVALDEDAVIRSTAAGILADQVPEMMGRLADPSAAAALELDTVTIVGIDPDREFVLSLGEPVTLGPGRAPSSAPELRLPTESLVRLMYGRLDHDHTSGPLRQEPDGLVDRLRTVFTGL